MPSLTTYAPLLTAIVLEVVGTSALQASKQCTRPGPTALMAVCYAGAFYFLSIALRTIPVGVAYAIWSGLGIVLITAIGYFAFRQKLDAPALVGLGLIIAGVAIINLYSKTIKHD
jgi:small multidrug resistance pump